MGSQFVRDIQETDLSLRDQISIHLRANCYPPVPLTMLDACVESVILCNEDLPNSEIDLPEGVYYRNYKTAPAWAIVDSHRLEGFITLEEED